MISNLNSENFLFISSLFSFQNSDFLINFNWGNKENHFQIFSSIKSETRASQAIKIMFITVLHCTALYCKQQINNTNNTRKQTELNSLNVETRILSLFTTLSLSYCRIPVVICKVRKKE